MFWDLIMSVAICITLSKEEIHDYQVKESIFYFKSIFGLLSFPFLIFNIPFLVQVLTKSRPTGYTEYGTLVPLVKTL